MSDFRPNAAAQMRTALRLLVPTVESSYGVAEKAFSPAEGIVMASVKMKGSADIVKNDLISVENTGEVVCWYRPDIAAGCQFEVIGAGIKLEILGAPENIDMFNQFLLCRVRQIKGGA